MATVTVSEGKLKGGKAVTEKGFQYYEFLGVPYAEPPVGDLRFKSPQSLKKWDNERDATTVNPENIACQLNKRTGEVSGSEDCLYLNVYTPKLFELGAELLPVIVYIHGGGFFYGNGILKGEQGPDHLIEQNVVVVTINYRLNVLGFLSLDIPDAPGNMGIKDQIKALEWIKVNIDKFYGNKNNVTILGLSAGSASVDYLILCPLAKGLFHKAILRSGSTLNHWAINFEVKELSLKLAETLGYKGSFDDKQAIYEFLRDVPFKQLVEGASKVSDTSVTNRVYFGFVPTVEKDFGNGEAVLTTHPYKLFKDGNFNNVPVIRGFCEKEGSLVSIVQPIALKSLVETKKIIDHWPYNFDINDIERYNSLLSAAYLENINIDDEDNKFAEDFFGDLDFIAGVWISAKLSSKKVPVYTYQFCYDGKLNMLKYIFGLKTKGALHGDDHTYVFQHDLLKSDNVQDLILRDRMTKMFTNFAKTGAPTPTSDVPVHWPVFTEKAPAYLKIDKDLSVESNYEPKKMAVYEEIYEKYEK